MKKSIKIVFGILWLFITLVFVLTLLYTVPGETYAAIQEATNNAPVLTPAGPVMTSITEDDIGNDGMLISDIVGDTISDADPGALEGIAIYITDSGNGKWQYSISDNPAWYDIGVVSTTEALLLASDDKVRFLPNKENGTNASFDYYAWDQTSGTKGDRADVSTRGGETAFSTVGDTAMIAVTDINDAPELGSGFTEEPITLWPRNYNHYGNGINQNDPRITSNGSDFLLVWYEEFNTGLYGVDTVTYISRFSDTGTPVDPEGVLAATTGGYWNDNQYPAVCAVNDDYWIFYGIHFYNEKIFTKVVNSNGDISDPVTVGSGEGLSTIDSYRCSYMNNQNVIAVWEQPPYPAKIFYSIITPERNVLIQNQLLVSGGDGYVSAVAAFGSYFLVVYYSEYGGPVSAVRIDAEGNIMDTQSIVVYDSFSDLNTITSLDVIPYSNGWLVVYDVGKSNWIDSFRGRFVSADGDVSDDLFIIAKHIDRSLSTTTEIHVIETEFGYQLAWSSQWYQDYPNKVISLDHDFNIISQDSVGSRNRGPQLNIARNDAGTTVAVWMKRQNFGSYDTGRLYGGAYDETWAMTHLPDHNIAVGEVLSHTFPVDTFYDLDNGDILTYSSTMNDDSTLPAWLNFTPGSRTFSGIPGNEDVGTIGVKVTATDTNAESASGIFDITVGDMDKDGIPDGDSTNPCTGGNTENCDDNCIDTPNPDQADADSDGVGDVCDNCYQTPNIGQQDTDSDGYGNICDADLDNDGVVGFNDYNEFGKAWGSDNTKPNWNPDADFDSDGVVGFNDYNIFGVRWGTGEPWY